MAGSYLLLLGFGLAAASVGCGSGSGQASGNETPVLGSTPVPIGADSLQFKSSATLTLEPMQRATLAVRVSPPGSYAVRFAIGPDSAGLPTDASLNQDEVVTDAAGVASVDVTAPTKATTFSVRATLGMLTADQGLSVSRDGFARLLISPEYTGKRKVSEWVVSASSRMDCATAATQPALNGDILARGPAAAGMPILLEALPASTQVTILVRADGLASGCQEMLAPLPGRTSPLSVSVSDVPFHFEAQSLRTTFAINSASQSFYDTLASDIGLAVRALTPPASNDVAELLDTMGSLAGPQQAQFAAARSQANWDARVKAVWGTEAALHLRTLANQWMSDGVKSLSEPEAFAGNLRATKSEPGQALFDVASVGQVDPVRAGFAPSAATTWSAEPGDTLVLGLNLFWRPSELVTALAERQAKTAQKTDAFATALKAALDCTQLGSKLAPTGAVYETCGAVCLADLCGDAGVVVWERAREASGIQARTLQVNASAQATVGTLAQVSTLKGNWLGMVSGAPQEISVAGTLAGTALP